MSTAEHAWFLHSEIKHICASLYLELHLWRVISKAKHNTGLRSHSPSREQHMWSSLIIPHQNSVVRTQKSTPSLKSSRFSWWVCFLLDRPLAICFHPCLRDLAGKSVSILYYSFSLTWTHFTDSRIVSTYSKSHVEECEVGVESCVFRGERGGFPELHQCFSTQHLTHCRKAKKHSSPH